MSSYQPGVPTGLVNLDVDYLSIQANFQQLDTSFGVDHVPFSNQTAQNGYHGTIHFNPFSTTVTNAPNNNPPVVPSAISGYGQLFSVGINDGINTDTSLYYLTGGNRLTQLTRNFQPTKTTNGSTYLPGGLIMQWGTVSVNTDDPIVFPMPFTSSILNIQLTGFYNNNSRGFWWVKTASLTQFTAALRDSSGSNISTRIYWMAIGV